MWEVVVAITILLLVLTLANTVKKLIKNSKIRMHATKRQEEIMGECEFRLYDLKRRIKDIHPDTITSQGGTPYQIAVATRLAAGLNKEYAELKAECRKLKGLK